MSVQLPCSLRNLRTEIVRSPCGDRPSHGARAGIVQYHQRNVYGLRAYDFFQICQTSRKPNRRGRGARESVRKSHSRLLHASAGRPRGGLTERGIQVGYGLRIDQSQAKCELGISELRRAEAAYWLRKRRTCFCMLRTPSQRGEQFV